MEEKVRQLGGHQKSQESDDLHQPDAYKFNLQDQRTYTFSFPLVCLAHVTYNVRKARLTIQQTLRLGTRKIVRCPY